MKWQVLKNRIQCENGTVCELPFDIKECVEVGEILLVVLDVRGKALMDENVFAISLRGEVLWTIQRVPDITLNPSDSYVGFVSIGGNSAKIASWNGWVVEVDIATGKVVGSQWLK